MKLRLRPSLWRLAGLSVLMVMLFSQPAAATFNNWKEYTFSSDSCSSFKDPLNLFFQLNVGAKAEAVSRLKLVVRLDATPVAGTDQWFYNYGS